MIMEVPSKNNKPKTENSELPEEYKKLIGKEFPVRYISHFDQFFHNPRPAFEVISPTKEVENILQEIILKQGVKVWKALTGPPEYPTFWIWLPCEKRESLSYYSGRGVIYQLKVTDVAPFNNLDLSIGTYTAAYTIFANVLHEKSESGESRNDGYGNDESGSDGNDESGSDYDSDGSKDSFIDGFNELKI